MPLKITVRISSNHFELKMRAQFVPNSCSGLPAYAHAQHSRGINVDGGSLELAIRVGLRFEAQRSHTRGRLTPCSSLDMMRTWALRKFATVIIQENRRRWVAPSMALCGKDTAQTPKCEARRAFRVVQRAVRRYH